MSSAFLPSQMLSAVFPARSSSPFEEPATGTPAPLICFCHLSWDWVWQRPQQFLSRLAKKRPLLFVETHCADVAESRIETKVPEGHPNVTVLKMHLPAKRWADGAFIDRERRRVLREFLAADFTGRFQHPVLWFNDPMAVTAFAGHFDELAIVYDCMDELSQFKGAPPALEVRERELLKRADVVFCGGRKMRDKRLPVNSNCHFYGTGVDCAHFGKARSSELAVDPEIERLGRPVLGYFGVIDERIDYELLAKLADARPDWSVAMVGPTAKVDPSQFPRRPNLHWLGSRSYAELPSITKGFSVCLMPFALNAATEYINPTKALEYMAAGKPVVSTALAEVRSNFPSVARIGRSHREFIAFARAEVLAPSRRRIGNGIQLAEQNTWEIIAAKMDRHIEEAILARRQNRVADETAASAQITTPLGASVPGLCLTT